MHTCHLPLSSPLPLSLHPLGFCVTTDRLRVLRCGYVWVKVHTCQPTGLSVTVSGPQVLFLSKCKDMENVVVSGNIDELGQWAEWSAKDRKAFNVQPGKYVITVTKGILAEAGFIGSLSECYCCFIFSPDSTSNRPNCERIIVKMLIRLNRNKHIKLAVDVSIAVVYDADVLTETRHR